MTGPAPLVYGAYDQAALDAQYNNSAKVADYDTILTRFRQLSQQARTQWVVESRLDVPVGAGPAERVDLFAAMGSARREGAPVLVFLHGGYWSALDKSDFSFVANGFMPHDIAVVVVNYGLIPEVRMDEQIHHCRQAVEWVLGNAGTFGGDPKRVYVCGHSAGGHLAAMMAATEWTRTVAPMGGCSISGLHDLRPIAASFLQKRLRLTDDEVAEFSPTWLAPPPTGLWRAIVGAQEGAEYLRQSVEWITTWQSAGSRRMSLEVMADLNHFSIIECLADPDHPLTRTIVTDMQAG